MGHGHELESRSPQVTLSVTIEAGVSSIKPKALAVSNVDIGLAEIAGLQAMDAAAGYRLAMVCRLYGAG